MLVRVTVVLTPIYPATANAFVPPPQAASLILTVSVQVVQAAGIPSCLMYLSAVEMSPTVRAMTLQHVPV